MSLDVYGMTPLDIAGKHNSKEAALVFIEFFSDNFDFVHQVFDPEFRNKEDDDDKDKGDEEN